jgi:hypothetical protein
VTDLDRFLLDTRRQLDAQLAACVPDLAAVVARARAIDPDAVPAAAVAEADALAQVLPLAPRASASSDRLALAPFAAAFRDALEVDLARELHRAAVRPAGDPPPAPTGAGWADPARESPAEDLPAPTASTRPLAPVIALTSRRPRVLAAALVAAAAVLLLVGVGAGVALRGGAGEAPGAAALAGPSDPPPGRADGTAVPGERPQLPVPEDSSSVPEDSSSEDRTGAPVPEDSSPEGRPGAPGPDAAPAVTSSVPKDSSSRARRPRRAAEPAGPAPTAPAEDPLAALEREALRRWQAGDLRGAAGLYRQVVDRAPGSRAAELALGDLFALEHRLGGDPVPLWREYLRAFPRGRFADDARAGICRRAAPAEQPACWRDYLAAHPQGDHRREAEAAAPE